MIWSIYFQGPLIQSKQIIINSEEKKTEEMWCVWLEDG